MSAATDRVRAAWVAFNTPLEALVHELYDDIRGLPTVADGILVPSVAAAQAMRWLRPDGSPASPEEVAAEWHRVDAMPRAMVWWRYESPTGLHLDDEELERVTLVRFDADLDALTRAFPGLPTWPWEAVAAALSMAWAMGPGFPPSWPIWSTAARRASLPTASLSDWRACAADCEIRWRDNPGVRPRDLAQQALFLLAAGASPEEARAAWPAGPSSDAAAKALSALGYQ